MDVVHVGHGSLLAVVQLPPLELVKQFVFHRVFCLCWSSHTKMQTYNYIDCMSDPRYAGVLDEPTTLLNIIREMLPAAAKSLTERSPNRRLTSKLQQEDYDDIRSHLMKIKLTPGGKKEQNTPGTSPARLSKAEDSPAATAAKTSPRRSRRRAFEADGSFEP